ncbi:MAG: hypothetical protein A2Z04_09395 [Chloroflexi bacterium RBG_16_57_9]|nr:MAG: hypothetical protein A2Z04_09395 [Chloroflexi bacterium RBG_16_57_9]
MTGKITALTVQQRNRERVNVFLDQVYRFSLSAIVAVPLRIGQTLSDADIARLQAQDTYQKAYDKALNYLSYRPRSRAEVERYLDEKKIAPEVVEAIIARLAEADLLDDSAFAKAWVENRAAFSPRGQRMLRRELYQKGLDASTVAEALQEVDEEAGAYQAARARAQRYTALDRATFERRLGGFLQRRGFDYDMVRSVVSRLWRELHTDYDN